MLRIKQSPAHMEDYFSHRSTHKDKSKLHTDEIISWKTWEIVKNYHIVRIPPWCHAGQMSKDQKFSWFAFLFQHLESLNLISLRWNNFRTFQMGQFDLHTSVSIKGLGFVLNTDFWMQCSCLTFNVDPVLGEYICNFYFMTKNSLEIENLLKSCLLE